MSISRAKGLTRLFSSSHRRKWIRFIFRERGCRQFHWPLFLRRGLAATRFPGLRVRIPPLSWMSLSCGCVFSCGGLCDGPISRPGESYRVSLCASLSVIRCNHNPLHQPFLTWVHGPFANPWINFRGSVNLDGKKIITLLSLTSDRNLGFHSITDVGNKEIYGIWILKQLKEFNICGSDHHYQIFWVVVGLERGPLSLVRSIEELLE